MSTTDTSWTWAWYWWGTLVALDVIHAIIEIYLFIRSRTDDNPADAKCLRMMRMTVKHPQN